MSIQLVLCERDVVVAYFQSVYITIWWEKGTVELLGRVRPYRKAFFESQRGQAATLSVICLTKPKPVTAEERRLTQEIIKEDAAKTSAEAIVIESSTAVMGAVRLIFAAMNLLAKARHPSKVFSSTKESVEWVAPLAKVDTKALMAAVEQAIAARSSSGS
jgi:hypothetical protein